MRASLKVKVNSGVIKALSTQPVTIAPTDSPITKIPKNIRNSTNGLLSTSVNSQLAESLFVIDFIPAKFKPN